MKDFLAEGRKYYIIYYGKSIGIMYNTLSSTPSTGMLRSDIGKIPKETGECEHHPTDQTLENLHGLQTYRS